MVRTALLLAVTVLATLSACGSEGSGATDGASDPTAQAATALTIVVKTSDTAEASTYELTCDPDGGDHPQPEQACAVLAKAGPSVFDAVPADQACTQVYGGPQTATVTGTFEGKDVYATFSRQNGCEVDRWEKLGTTFFNVPLL